MDDTDPEQQQQQQLAGLAGLADPVRRALYHYVAGQAAPVGRDEAAAAAGIGRSLAGYHLDKLAAGGLLQARYERRTGRTGPGAGRPAKLYLRAPGQIELSLPARDYAALAELLAQAVDADPAGAARTALHGAARALGTRLGAEIAARAGPGAGVHEVLAMAREVLGSRGYEPCEDPAGVVRLRNCPFDRLAARHRELVCGANLALISGLTQRAAGTGQVRAELDPRPGSCCVALTATDPAVDHEGSGRPQGNGR
jgi:predicted ArsR family transcriptional regulator